MTTPYTGPLDAFRAQVLLGRGEMTVDEVVEGITDGSIELPEPYKADKDDPNWWNEVEAQDPPPFLSLVPHKVSKADYRKLWEAVERKRGATDASIAQNAPLIFGGDGNPKPEPPTNPPEPEVDPEAVADSVVEEPMPEPLTGGG